MELHEQLDAGLSENLELNDMALGYLAEAAKWGKFIAIVGFVMIGFFVIFALFFGAIIGNVSSILEGSGMDAMNGGIVTGMYLAMTVLYFFPTLYLYKFSVKTAAALREKSSLGFALGAGYLKSMFKFMGILLIVIIGMYALMLVFIVIMAATDMAM